MILNGAAAIENHKGEINELNVFPVPDGDTGTNMSLTMGAGAAALSNAPVATVGKASDVTAAALLRGARGNSGVILSLLFRGIARRLKDLETAGAADFAQAITDGVDSAYKAVMKPAEGTILTVSRLLAEAAVLEAEKTDDIEAVLEASLKAGGEALANTINQNPILKKAGVVDAGGKGFLYIMEGMLKALRGVTVFQNETGSVGAEKADFSDFETADINFTYCTEFIAGRASTKDVGLLRAFLDALGDSVVVVDDDEIIKVHVHSNEPGAVLTEALTYGPLLSVKIENMKEQHTGKLVETRAPQPEPAALPEAGEAAPMPEPAPVPETIPEQSEAMPFWGASMPDVPPAESVPDETAVAAPDDDVLSEPEKDFAVVAVCAGAGLCGVFRELGADAIIIGGQTMNPSTADILAKIEAVPSQTVFVLPNNKNIIMAAQQCMRLTEKKVVVIPTKTMPQGISAMIALDVGASVTENIALMEQAAGRVHTAQITYAARDSSYDGHVITAGDYIALLEDTLVATGKDTASLVDAVAVSLAAFSPEFITVFSGEDVDAETADSVLKRLTTAIPQAEASLVDGGQPVYYFLISAE
ncbi:DAK2 domain-containing protein [Oscillospiraceae bacterium CM]|nr:DAK2 domain-containing protein [Oscillospiraceae bacterium CM]